LAQINDLKATAQAFGWDALKTGSWFNQFLHACLSSYHERVIQQGGEAYLRSKYPGLPTDAVAGKLCEMAEQAAAIAGSLSGAAASGAVLTAGAGIPVAVTAVMGEVLFTIRLQLRLVFDIHLLYGIPLDAGDSEDLLGIFAIVYGVKLADIGGVAAKTLGPEVIRAQLFRLIHGNTKLIQQAVSRVMGPRIARRVTQKAILRTAVPVVGVAISAGWNYTATKLMASRVRQEVRIKAGLREETLRLHERIRSDEQIALPVIEGLVALATADGEFSDLELEVYLAFLRKLELGEDQLKMLAGKVHADIDGVLNALRSITEDQSREAIGRCFCLIAAANGDVSDHERELLKQFLVALGQEHQIAVADDLCARFRREEGVLGQAMGAVSDAVSSSASSVGEAMGSAMEWMSKAGGGKPSPEQSASTQDQFQSEPAETQSAELLRKAAELDEQLAQGVITADDYQKRWEQLETGR
jgi:tellurite resistance protein